MKNPFAATGATFAPAARLTPRTPSSYTIVEGTPEQVAAHLALQGWHSGPGHCAAEIARVRDCQRGLVVLYAETALVQGQQARGHAALAGLVEGEWL
jgi:hypothetical protein